MRTRLFAVLFALAVAAAFGLPQLLPVPPKPTVGFSLRPFQVYPVVDQERAAKPEFVPGTRVQIRSGNWTIEGTLTATQTVNRTRKGNRLSSVLAKDVARASSRKIDFYNGPSCSPLSDCDVAVE